MTTRSETLTKARKRMTELNRIRAQLVAAIARQTDALSAAPLETLEAELRGVEREIADLNEEIRALDEAPEADADGP
ncbi:MAG: hypothetical protein M0T84_12610 [Betaproteobacteria bacterium]|nr:hypothetical protein [Betaproteobacteria bacterium]